MTEGTWNTRDLPVLRAVVETNEGWGRYINSRHSHRAAHRLGHDKVKWALRRLNSQLSFLEKVVKTSGGQMTEDRPAGG
jgi:hypothetical protein